MRWRPSWRSTHVGRHPSAAASTPRMAAASPMPWRRRPRHCSHLRLRPLRHRRCLLSPRSAPSAVAPQMPTVVPAATLSPARDGDEIGGITATRHPAVAVGVRATTTVSPAGQHVIAEAPGHQCEGHDCPWRSGDGLPQRCCSAHACQRRYMASAFGLRLLPRLKRPASLVVSTNPPGVSVIVDGQPRGATPLTLELAAGAHQAGAHDRRSAARHSLHPHRWRNGRADDRTAQGGSADGTARGAQRAPRCARHD